MITIKLRAAIQKYQSRTGKRLSYASLSEMTGISRHALESMASRPGYNASLRTIDRLCMALECSPAELLEFRRNGLRVRTHRI